MSDKGVQHAQMQRPPAAGSLVWGMPPVQQSGRMSLIEGLATFAGMASL